MGSMGPKLYLLENVQVEVGKGRPFQESDLNFPDIDNSQRLYPIRAGAMTGTFAISTRSGFRLARIAICTRSLAVPVSATRQLLGTGTARWSTV